MTHETSPARWDVVVVGGGHAGSEAAAASARAGARTLLVTLSRATIGEMSCNPAIGGIGKGHLVREVDALDGLMGRAIDAAGIHFKLLNRSKGPAVRGPRAQADRARYRDAIQGLLRETAGLVILEGSLAEIVLDPTGAVAGVLLEGGRQIGCGAVVITTGTFLRGRIFIGDRSWPAGRYGEAASSALAQTFQRLGVAFGRLKTGTPPRISRRSIDWQGLEEDPSEHDPEPFSTMTDRITATLTSCRITHTTERTHGLIRANLHRSAVYGGQIGGRGPRYCPSIEDKVVRFAERSQHQVFLEPEGLEDDTVYPNGISTSLPEDVQHELVRSMPGMERAEILRAGYAVEYDFVDPRHLEPTLELRAARGLFLAGQINGTTGYEEAAGQGVLAGINAARRAGGGALVRLDRADGYIGVMVDDLTLRGVTEPYRMFTSRAEYRLTLRADNADSRLTPKGLAWGVVGKARAQRFDARCAAMARGRDWMRANGAMPAELSRHGVAISADGRWRSVFEVIGTLEEEDPRLAAAFPALQEIPASIRRSLRADSLYGGYAQRQAREIDVLRREEQVLLGQDIDFGAIGGLSAELQAKLQTVRPRSLGAASRIEGMTPSALAALMLHAAKSGHVSRET